MNFLNGEKEVIKTVVEAGSQYGYGNMIDRLKIAWVLKLKQSPNCSWETACLGALSQDDERIERFVKLAEHDEADLIRSLQEYICCN